MLIMAPTVSALGDLWIVKACGEAVAFVAMVTEPVVFPSSAPIRIKWHPAPGAKLDPVQLVRNAPGVVGKSAAPVTYNCLQDLQQTCRSAVLVHIAAAHQSTCLLPDTLAPSLARFVANARPWVGTFPRVSG
jgi:hypothetical protein